MEQLLLGIDVGTSSCKVALFRLDGEAVSQAEEAYPTYYPQEGWVEQDPDMWWNAVVQATRRVIAESGRDPQLIRGIGVAGQSWAAVAVDESGWPLCNTPLWMDARSGELCEALRARVEENKMFSLCGNPLEPTYTLPKILWYRENMPHVYRRIHKILQSNGFIVLRLTGVFTQDVSQGYGYACYDIRHSRWDAAACRELGIEINMLPPLCRCHQVVGGVTADAARQLGLAEGTPVVAGGLDAACGTLGAGVIHAGETQEQGGQAGGMSICLDEFRADRRLILSNHVIPGKWLLQGGSVGGGGVLRWAERELGQRERMQAGASGKSAFFHLDESVRRIAPGCDGVVFLPYMAGERSPVWDKRAKGVFYGLDYTKTREHMLRACMEGVAYSLRHNLETAESCGAQVSVMYAVGGSAKSELWTQMKADVTGKEIAVSNTDTATTLGAALLAGVGVGVYSDFEDAVDRTVRVKRRYLPNRRTFSKYQAGYRTYLRLSERLFRMADEGEENTRP